MSTRSGSQAAASSGAPERRAGLLRTTSRALLAGPFALIAACLLMAGGAVWIPPGRAQVNDLALPIVLFPLLWTALFLYACLDRKLARAWSVLGLLALVNGALVAWHLSH